MKEFNTFANHILQASHNFREIEITENFHHYNFTPIVSVFKSSEIFKSLNDPTYCYLTLNNQSDLHKNVF